MFLSQSKFLWDSCPHIRTCSHIHECTATSPAISSRSDLCFVAWLFSENHEHYHLESVHSAGSRAMFHFAVVRAELTSHLGDNQQCEWKLYIQEQFCAAWSQEKDLWIGGIHFALGKARECCHRHSGVVTFVDPSKKLPSNCRWCLCFLHSHAIQPNLQQMASCRKCDTKEWWGGH